MVSDWRCFPSRPQYLWLSSSDSLSCWRTFVMASDLWGWSALASSQILNLTPVVGTLKLWIQQSYRVVGLEVWLSQSFAGYQASTRHSLSNASWFRSCTTQKSYQLSRSISCWCLSQIQPFLLSSWVCSSTLLSRLEVMQPWQSCLHMCCNQVVVYIVDDLAVQVSWMNCCHYLWMKYYCCHFSPKCWSYSISN